MRIVLLVFSVNYRNGWDSGESGVGYRSTDSIRFSDSQEGFGCKRKGCFCLQSVKSLLNVRRESSSVEYLAYLAKVGIGVLAHSEVVGVDALYHRILCEPHLIVAETVEVLHALFPQRLVCTLLLLVGTCVPINVLLGTGSVGIVVLHQ